MREIVELLEDRQMPVTAILRELNEKTLRLAPELLNGAALRCLPTS